MNREEIHELVYKLNPNNTCKSSGPDHVSVNCLFKKGHSHGDKVHSAAITIVEGGESYYSCFGCGVKGGLLDVLYRFKKGIDHIGGKPIDLPAILEAVRLVGKVSLQKSKNRVKKKVEYPNNDAYYKALKTPGKEVRRFLKAKGLTGEDQIMMLREHNRVNVAFPYFRENICVGMKIRNIYGESSSKYYQIKGLQFPTIEIFWGEWLYLKKNPEVLFIVEGELDAAYLMQFGLNAVAMCGTSWGIERNDNLIFNIQPEAVIGIFDDDKAGKRAKIDVRKALLDYCVVKTILMDDLRKVKKGRFLDEQKKIKRKI